MTGTLLPSPPELFERSGGDLCLDFINTWGDRGRRETDRLEDYARLLRFAQESDLLERSALKALADRAAQEPSEAAKAFRQAVDLREALYRLFSARARNRALAAKDLERVNASLGAALAHLRLEPQNEGCQWAWSEVSEHLDAPLWPILRSAARLLVSPKLAWVRECDGAQCTWLFLDLSRTHSRRWCSMASCGNRAKARRHYQRKKT
jgi:predicted RNA-binding Zn ribbon-like protein